jgi:hypothetical protein
MNVLFATMKVERARQVFARYEVGILLVVVVDILGMMATEMNRRRVC